MINVVMSRRVKKLHVYVRCGCDQYGEFVETVYFPEIVPETDKLEYIGEIDSSKVNLYEDTKTYI